MKKVIKVLLITLIITVFSTALLITAQSKNKVSVKRDFEPTSLNELICNSQEIVIAKVSQNSKMIKEEGITFYLSDLMIQKSIKGSLEKGHTIKLLQTECYEDPIVIHGEKVFLFLEKYEGYLSEDNNTYVCKGLYQGHYKIKDNKIGLSLKKEKTNWQENIDYNVEIFTENIEQIAKEK